MSWWVLRVRPDGSVVDTLGYSSAYDFVTLSSGVVTPRLFGNRAGDHPNRGWPWPAIWKVQLEWIEGYRGCAV